MTFEQTVEIPVSHRLRLDIEVPQEIPAGRAIITFTSTAAALETERRLHTRAAIERCAGIAKRTGAPCTSDDLLAERRRDKEQEDAKYRRLFPQDENGE
jgi:hypothetical protein